MQALKIILIGYGRMGKEIKQVAEKKGHEVILTIDKDNQEDLSIANLKKGDVAIEFTIPDSAYDNIIKCFEADIPVVSGTTGWMDRFYEIRKRCIEQDKSFFHAPNFNIGVNLFFKVNSYLAKIMNNYPDYDIEVEETHHIHKLDAPSGTAVSIAESILREIKRKNKWVKENAENEGELEVRSIREDEKASAAITALDVTLRDGTTTVEEKELSTTATSHTFSVCEPGVSYWASVRAVYTQDAYEDLSGSSTEVRVLYGPWASDSVTLGGTRKTESLSVGSFNHQDGLPSGQFSLSDFYYYNPYNPDYLFAAENDETWIVVDVYERTDTNEEDRNNVNYLTENVELLDSNTTGLTSYDDMADVDLEFYDIYNNKIFELTGTNTSGTISSSDYSSLIDSVNSGYYEDKDGVFFIRAICKSMPSTFSDSNSEDQLGYWGLAIYGASKNYE